MLKRIHAHILLTMEQWTASDAIRMVVMGVSQITTQKLIPQCMDGGQAMIFASLSATPR
jgi:hypothetical protein